MNKFERFILRWLLRRCIHQGGWYATNTRELYQEIYQHTKKTFPEDNKPTRDCYLQKLFLQVLYNDK